MFFLLFALLVLVIPVTLLCRQHMYLKKNVSNPLNKAYLLAKNLTHLVQTLVTWGIMLFWTVGGGLEFLTSYFTNVNTLSFNLILLTCILCFTLFFNTIIDYYRTFQIEARFGFNRSSILLFLSDEFKGLILTFILVVPILLFMIWITQISGQYWWLSIWLILAISVFTFNILYQSFLIKWFNKLDPLKEGALKDELTKLAQKLAFNPNRVFVIDNSKRSTHGNAYVAGLGRFKRIVLFDTLLDQLTANEITAVLSHELGHSQLHHEFKLLSVFAIFSGLVLFLSQFINPTLLNLPDHISPIIILLIAFPILKLILQPVSVYFSRRFEYEADQFATLHTPAKDLSDALTKLSQHSRASHTSDKFYAAFYESHPMISQRIKHLENMSCKS